MATITKRGDSYRIAVSCGYNLDGKQIRRYHTWTAEPGMTQKQIEKELKRQTVLFEEKCKNGQVLEGNTRFADFAERWFSDYADKQLRPKTLARYHSMMPRINAAIGHIKLDKLQPHHLMEFYANLEEADVRADVSYCVAVDLKELLKSRSLSKQDFAQAAGICTATAYSILNGKNVSLQSAERISQALDIPMKDLCKPSDPNRRLSPKTIAHYHRLISSILTAAVKWQVVFSNPCGRVQAPRIQRKETKYLDEQQAAHLLALLDEADIMHRTAVKLLLYLGMCRGELFGLEWDDINFEHSVICVRRTSQYLPGKGIFTDDTKNESSQRAVKAPTDAMVALRQYRTWQLQERLKAGDQWNPEWDQHPRLFTTWDGHPAHPNNLTVWLHRFIAKHDLPPISVHGLRHSNASILIAEGVNLQTVASRLGHADIATTTKIYSHAIKSADAAAAQTLQDIFHGGKKKA